MEKFDKETDIDRFELALSQVFQSFTDWQETCHLASNNEPLSAEELSLLHIIQMHGSSKTIKDLAEILNRHDYDAIKYAVRKLCKLGWVTKVKVGNDNKKIAFQITEDGIVIGNQFAALRSAIFKDLFSNTENDMTSTSKKLIEISSNYREAKRQLYILKHSQISSS